MKSGQRRCGVRPLAESVEPEARRYNTERFNGEDFIETAPKRLQEFGIGHGGGSRAGNMAMLRLRAEDGIVTNRKMGNRRPGLRAGKPLHHFV